MQVKNSSGHLDWFSKFPFLVGRIRAKWLIDNMRHPPEMFPFLVGRIRAPVELISRKLSWRFPFLVGRIRAQAI